MSVKQSLYATLFCRYTISMDASFSICNDQNRFVAVEAIEEGKKLQKALN